MRFEEAISISNLPAPPHLQAGVGETSVLSLQGGEGQSALETWEN